jgi:hypothetical protein
MPTTKNPVFHFGSRVGENYGRDSYLLPGPPLSSTAKWAEEAKYRIRPRPRVEDISVPADGLICGVDIRIKSLREFCSCPEAVRQQLFL